MGYEMGIWEDKGNSFIPQVEDKYNGAGCRLQRTGCGRPDLPGQVSSLSSLPASFTVTVTVISEGSSTGAPSICSFEPRKKVMLYLLGWSARVWVQGQKDRGSEGQRG
jgi:hypothetical protein